MMWPWEHVVVAYLLYSILRRVLTGVGPTGRETIVLAFAAVLPDLIDKPLSWQFGLFEPSYGPGHSLLVAVFVCTAVLMATVSSRRPILGAAFGIGYLSHLVTDVVAIGPRGVRFDPDRVMWPIRAPESGGDHASLFDAFTHYLSIYLTEVQSGENHLELAGYLALLLAGVLLWVHDGMPGWRLTVTTARTSAARIIR